MSRRPKRAFTLLELLVVVAIIAVLLTILLPAVESSLEMARRVVCGSNERSWGTSLMAYATTNQLSYPYNGQAIPLVIPIGGHNVSWNSSAVQDFWKAYLTPDFDAAKDERNDILNCPTRQWHTLDELDLGLAQLLGAGDGLSGYFYLPHRYPYSIDYTPAGMQWVSRTKLGRQGAANLPVMMDVKQNDGTGSWLVNGFAVSSHANRDGTPEGGNFLFEDSHVDWYPSDQIDLGATMLTWNFWYKIPVR